MKISGMMVFGIAVLGLGVFGVYNAIMSIGRPEVEKRDVTTTGVVTRVHGTEIRHNLTNIKMNSEFKLSYKFMAEDGEEYFDTKSINESQFRSVNEGEKITVRYHSNNPYISAPVKYSTYYPVDSGPEPTPLNRAGVSFGMCLFGSLIVFLTVRGQKQSHVADAEFSDGLQSHVPGLMSR